MICGAEKQFREKEADHKYLISRKGKGEENDNYTKKNGNVCWFAWLIFRFENMESNLQFQHPQTNTNGYTRLFMEKRYSENKIKKKK